MLLARALAWEGLEGCCCFIACEFALCEKQQVLYCEGVDVKEIDAFNASSLDLFIELSSLV